ncbi:MAG: RNA polymerase-binding protein DksA [Burkholderiales bacterium]
MSKTPAKKTNKVAGKPVPKSAAAKSSAAKKVSKVTKQPPAKPPVKQVASKTAAKPTAKKVVAKKPTTKTVTKPSAKSKAPVVKKSAPAPKKLTQPVAKVEKSATKPTPAPEKKKPPVTAPKHNPSQAAAAVAMPATASPAAASTPAPTRRGGKVVAPPPAQAPLPLPTSRFADRFAPPRPPTRQMNNLGLDAPKPTQIADPKLVNAWKTKAGKDLTDAEVLAMPEKEYMNEKQLEFFRARLQALKDDLLSNAGETTEHLREDTSIVPDPADRATIEEEHALELRTRDRERKLLKKISQSLIRIDAGDYGFCDETGEPIGLGRLIARPTATLSLEAQQRRELKQKMFGD